MALCVHGGSWHNPLENQGVRALWGRSVLFGVQMAIASRHRIGLGTTVSGPLEASISWMQLLSPWFTATISCGVYMVVTETYSFVLSVYYCLFCVSLFWSLVLSCFVVAVFLLVCLFVFSDTYTPFIHLIVDLSNVKWLKLALVLKFFLLVVRTDNVLCEILNLMLLCLHWNNQSVSQ